MKNLFLTALSILIWPAYVAAAPVGSPGNPIAPTTGADYIGQHIVVEGVANIQKSSHRLGTDIVIDGHDESGPIFGYIPENNVSQFPELSRYNGKAVDLNGVVQFYRGVPEIILTSNQQVRLAGAGPGHQER